MTPRIELSRQPAACVPGDIVSTLMIVETLERGSRSWPQSQRPATVEDLSIAGYVSAQQLVALQMAGAVLLRTIYDSGVAYDNPKVEAALAVFALAPVASEVPPDA